MLTISILESQNATGVMYCIPSGSKIVIRLVRLFAPLCWFYVDTCFVALPVSLICSLINLVLVVPSRLILMSFGVLDHI